MMMLERSAARPQSGSSAAQDKAKSPMPERSSRAVATGDGTPPSRPPTVSGTMTPPKAKKPKSSCGSKKQQEERKKKQEQPRRKQRKEKIRTYCRRKAEIEELMGEMARLKAEMALYAKRNEVLKEGEELRQRQETNQALRDVLHTQRLAFASSLSMVSHVLREKHTGPFDTLMYLPKDPYARHLELLRMKQERVQRAYDFMRERQRFMDVSTEYCDQKKFQAMNGYLCSERFEVMPLPGANNVKAIVDALGYFVYNIEICISEVLGDITIRENDDPQRNSSIAQHRLVTTIGDRFQMDTNNVAFNEYFPPGPGQSEVGFSISDAVDEDEAFPYHEKERVRQDVTVIIMVSWQRRQDGTSIIVLARWWCLRIRRFNIDVPHYVVARIQNGMEYVGAAMMAAAQRAGNAM